MNVILLAGGQGTRMEDPKPKPLVKAKGKPIIAYQLNYFLNSGVINKIILALGFRADEIIDFVNKNYADKPIEFSIEESPLGTGGAIKQALKKADSEFVIALNCDDLTDIDLNELSKIKENTICVTNPRLPFGRVVDDKGYARFEEKPLLKDMWVSLGWYLLNRKEMLDIIPDKASIEYDVYPKINLRMYKHTGYWQPLNSKKDIIEFENKDLPEAFK